MNRHPMFLKTARWLATLAFFFFAAASHADIQLTGNFGYTIDQGARTVRLSADRIENTSATNSTGSLRMELWATSTPYNGGNISGYRVATYRINSSSNGTLGPNQYYYNISGMATVVNWPPDGSYYATMIVTEYDSVNCPASDHFCIADYGNFTAKLVIGSGGGTPPPTTGTTPLQISGSYSAIVDFGANTVRFMMDRLQNTSTSRTSGTLRLELWATTTPYYGGNINGYRVSAYQIGGSTNGTLSPGQYFYNIDVTKSISSRPPGGVYYLTMIVSEYTSTCTTADHFCIAAYGQLSSPLTAPNASGGSGNPGTPAPVCLKYKKGKCKKWK